MGIDLGGTTAKIAVVDGTGRVIRHDQVPTGPGCRWDALVDDVAACSRALTHAAGRTIEALSAVGFASAGLIDQAAGVLRSSPNLPLFLDVPVRASLGRAFARPVDVENDATAFAYGEWASGAARGARHAVFVTLGTGVGGGIVANGVLHRGAHGFAGEIGHACVSIASDAPLCACGRTGCVEAYVGAAAIVRRARAVLGEDGALTPADVAARADRGDASARGVLAEAGDVLGTALGALVNALDPEVIVVGGGVAGAGRWVLEPAERTLAARALTRTPPPIRRAAHGPLSGAIGAALVARASAETAA